MRRFRLVRNEDKTGISGIGPVAEGIQFTDGKCVMKWTTTHTSICIYDDVKSIEHIHGHGGSTVVQWLDENHDDFGKKEPTFLVKSEQGAKVAEGATNVMTGEIEIYLPDGILTFASAIDARQHLELMFGPNFMVVRCDDFQTIL